MLQIPTYYLFEAQPVKTRNLTVKQRKQPSWCIDAAVHLDTTHSGLFTLFIYTYISSRHSEAE